MGGKKEQLVWLVIIVVEGYREFGLDLERFGFEYQFYFLLVVGVYG